MKMNDGMREWTDMDETTKRIEWQGLSGSALKLLAVVTMVVDHTAAYLLQDMGVGTAPLLTVSSTEIAAVDIMRGVARMGFPLFCFLLVEGFVHTRNTKKYGLYLFLFALISEIPWDLIRHNTVFCLDSQNVFFTLWMGWLGMYLSSQCCSSRFDRFLCMVPLMVVMIFLQSDYGLLGFLFIMALYSLRGKTYRWLAAGLAVLYNGWLGLSYLVPVAFYNGQRGFVQGPVSKWFFYLFYPVHLFLIWVVRMMM